MKRFLINSAIVLGVLVAGFIVVLIAVIVMGDDENEIQQYSYVAGYAFGLLVMICSAAILIFGMFKLTITIFFKKDDNQEDNVLDKDGPIDRYLK